MRRQAAEPHFEDDNVYRERWRVRGLQLTGCRATSRRWCHLSSPPARQFHQRLAVLVVGPGPPICPPPYGVAIGSQAPGDLRPGQAAELPWLSATSTGNHPAHRIISGAGTSNIATGTRIGGRPMLPRCPIPSTGLMDRRIQTRMPGQRS